MLTDILQSTQSHQVLAKSGTREGGSAPSTENFGSVVAEIARRHGEKFPIGETASEIDPDTRPTQWGNEECGLCADELQSVEGADEGEETYEAELSLKKDLPQNDEEPGFPQRSLQELNPRSAELVGKATDVHLTRNEALSAKASGFVEVEDTHLPEAGIAPVLQEHDLKLGHSLDEARQIKLEDPAGLSVVGPGQSRIGDGILSETERGPVKAATQMALLRQEFASKTPTLHLAPLDTGLGHSVSSPSLQSMPSHAEEGLQTATSFQHFRQGMPFVEKSVGPEFNRSTNTEIDPPGLSESLRQKIYAQEDGSGASLSKREVGGQVQTGLTVVAAAPTLSTLSGQEMATPQQALTQNLDQEAVSVNLLEESLHLTDRPLVGSRDTGGIFQITRQPTSGEMPQGLTIVRQVTDAVRGSSRPGIEIALSPEELGSVRLRLTGSDGQMVVIVQAERPETLDLMRRHIDFLSQDFRAIGYGEVSFSFQSGKEGQHDAPRREEPPFQRADDMPVSPEERNHRAITLVGGLDKRI